MEVESVQVSKNKTYPHDEEDIKHEKEIVDAIKKIDLDQRFQFIALNNLTLQKKQQDADMDAEMKSVVNKYNKLQEPLSEASDQLICGRALTADELAKVKEHLSDEDLHKLDEANRQEVIPKYWATALKNCGPLGAMIEEADAVILEHLTQIDYKTEEDNDNFTVTFHFSPNEHFENKLLSVKFYMLNENEAEKCEATEINWKEGKNITKKTVTKKQKNKKTGKTREIKKEVDADSFFNFFKTLDIEKAGGDDADEEEGEALFEKLDLNLQTAQAIETELLPYHLEYFLGVREPSDDGDYDDMDEEDDDDDDDDDSDEDVKPKKGASKPKKKESGDAKEGGEQKQECKQQ